MVGRRSSGNPALGIAIGGLTVAVGGGRTLLAPASVAIGGLAPAVGRSRTLLTAERIAIRCFASAVGRGSTLLATERIAIRRLAPAVRRGSALLTPERITIRNLARRIGVCNQYSDSRSNNHLCFVHVAPYLSANVFHYSRTGTKLRKS